MSRISVRDHPVTSGAGPVARQRVVDLLRRAWRLSLGTTYTCHTNRDTYDKVVADDKNNAVLTAMLVYRPGGTEQLAGWRTCR
jgi:hypothetical protein